MTDSDTPYGEYTGNPIGEEISMGEKLITDGWLSKDQWPNCCAIQNLYFRSRDERANIRLNRFTPEGMKTVTFPRENYPSVEEFAEDFLHSLPGSTQNHKDNNTYLGHQDHGYIFSLAPGPAKKYRKVLEECPWWVKIGPGLYFCSAQDYSGIRRADRKEHAKKMEYKNA